MHAQSACASSDDSSEVQVEHEKEAYRYIVRILPNGEISIGLSSKAVESNAHVVLSCLIALFQRVRRIY